MVAATIIPSHSDMGIVITAELEMSAAMALPGQVAMATFLIVQPCSTWTGSLEGSDLPTALLSLG